MLRKLLKQTSPLPPPSDQARGAGGLADPQLMTRATVLMFVMGGTCGLGTLALAYDPAVNRTAGMVITIAAYFMAVTLWWWGGVIPPAVAPYSAAAGTVMVSVAIYQGGSIGGVVFPLIFIWGALYSFTFFTPRVALAEVCLIALGFSAAAYANGHVPMVYVVMVMGTIAAQAPFVRYLVSEIVDLGRIDPLTGIANRRAFEEQMEYVRRDVQRSGRENALIMLDIDHFKRYNDNLGHPEGDRLLCDATKAWLTVLRESDLLARFGGEEFIILLRDCGLDGARECGDRLRAVMPHGMTCSAGYGVLQKGEDVSHLIARADLALYEAKNGGRNLTVMAPDELPRDVDVTAQSARVGNQSSRPSRGAR